MKTVRVPAPADFDQTVSATVSAATGPVFVVLFGDAEDGTGESWCPDCVIADPHIRKAVGALKGSILIECPVGSQAQYKNKPEHAYRVHPQIRLTAIPTLIHWSKGHAPHEPEGHERRCVMIVEAGPTALQDGPGSRLVEGELATLDHVQAWLKTVTQ